MGKYIIDQYSLLHFASGIIAYFWNISLTNWIIIHVLFEYLENTDTGMNIINKIKLWPGGKPHPDSYINSLFDNIFSILGWIVSYYADKYSTIKHLYI
jgi:hypothetical protein